MPEMINVYNAQGKKIGTMSKKEYYKLDTEEIPWIKCCTCFVIDSANQKILFEKRGKRFLDPGKLDLCSGHVQAHEVPIQGMVRELDEELNIKEKDSRNLHFLGNVVVDYTNLEDETNRKPLKCFVSAYALKMPDISDIQIDKKEAITMGWLNYEDAIGFITNSMTRLPYEKSLEEQYASIFQSLKQYMGLEKRKNLENSKDVLL